MFENNTHSSFSKGFLYALLCYICWGVFPLYWHMLANIPSLIILANRMLWSSVFLVSFCIIKNRQALWVIINNKQNIYYMSIAGILITVNWGTYIYAVNHQFIVESSLGYYINPLINIIRSCIFKGKINPTGKNSYSVCIYWCGLFYYKLWFFSGNCLYVGN